MKSLMYFLSYLIVVTIIILSSCKKEDKGNLPTIETLGITNITDSFAISGGNITDDGGMTVISRGVCWSTGIKPTIADNKTIDGAGAGNFSSSITELNGGTTYYVRAYATNSAGTGYGMAMSFKTLGNSPNIATQSVTNFRFNGVTLNGVVSPNYLSTTVTFEYGTTTGYEFSVNASPNIIEGSGNNSVTANLTDLSLNSIYYYRIKAVNALGTAYSEQMTFTIWMNSPGQQIIDYDGNNYNTVKIGNQTWMAENLETTHYRDGTAIPNVTSNSAWMGLTNGAYCWPLNMPENKDLYGAYYNWFTVVNNHNLCPLGWHIPSTTEFEILEDFLGGSNIAGGKMKTTGTIEEETGLWKSPNSGADNSSGFTTVPAGYRNWDGNFYGMGGDSEGFWTSVSKDSRDSYSRSYRYNTSESQDGNYWKTAGSSIRCVKD